MNKAVHVSAPGKLFVLGEHAVVFNGSSLVTAVDARLHVRLKTRPAEHPKLYINAPDVDLADWSAPLERVLIKSSFEGASRFIESCVALFFEYYRAQLDLKHDLIIETQSDFGARLGLGSSSATVAACLFGLAQLYGVDVPLNELFLLGVEVIQQVQRLGSGADLAAALYGGTVYYANQNPRRIVPLRVADLPLLVVYSGQKAGTVNYVQQVERLHETLPHVIAPILETMLTIVEDGRNALETEDWGRLGQLMNVQHGLLDALGVDTLALAEIVFAAREAGALGAKLSGAGGGDCTIVLVDAAHRQAVLDHIQALGKDIVDVKVNAEGVRVETGN